MVKNNLWNRVFRGLEVRVSILLRNRKASVV